MAFPRADEMVWIGGRWWWFPTASVDVRSALFEWRDNRAYLVEPDGTAIEGIVFAGEVSPE